MRLKVLGPVDEVTGYGEIARQIIFHLRYLNIDILVQSQFWGCTRIRLPENLHRIIEKAKRREAQYDGCLYVSTPPFFRKKGIIPAIGLSMSEVDGIPPQWVEYCNKVDRVLVPSSFNLGTFQRSGVQQDRLRRVALGVDSRLYSPDGPKLVLDPISSLFTFLSVGEWVPRKGFDLLVKAFVREFSVHDQVGLVLKCHSTGSDYDPEGKMINREVKAIIRRENKKEPPPVIVLSRTLAGPEMPSLYRAAHCFVLPTRGEGWGMPVFEALACGLPVIVTNWSAYLDYLNAENAYLIEVERLEPVPSYGLGSDEIYRGRRWAKPDMGHLCRLMRHVYNNYREAKEKAKRGQDMVREKLSWEMCCRNIVGQFEELYYP